MAELGAPTWFRSFYSCDTCCMRAIGGTAAIYATAKITNNISIREKPEDETEGEKEWYRGALADDKWPTQLGTAGEHFQPDNGKEASLSRTPDSR